MLAERCFRRLDAPELLADVYDGRPFSDGQAIAKPFKSLAKKCRATHP